MIKNYARNFENKNNIHVYLLGKDDANSNNWGKFKKENNSK